MTTVSPIITRIQKLLELAKSSNEHEAAAAADRAAALMAQHEISEAEVRVNAPNGAPAEPIEHLTATTTSKKVAWQMALAWGLAKKFHSRYYTHGGKIVFFGRTSNVQAAAYTLKYLIREVERLCDNAPDRAMVHPMRMRSWCNAFRVGCAQRIAARLEAQAEAVVYPSPSPSPSAAAAADAGSPAPSAGALVIIQRDRLEVEEAYKAQGFRKGRSIGAVSSRGGYEAGRAAGDHADLGGARTGLGAGKKVLRG